MDLSFKGREDKVERDLAVKIFSTLFNGPLLILVSPSLRITIYL
jgi:hypothetical protein